MQNYRDKKKKEKLDNAIRTKSGEKKSSNKKTDKEQKDIYWEEEAQWN